MGTRIPTGGYFRAHSRFLLDTFTHLKGKQGLSHTLRTQDTVSIRNNQALTWSENHIIVIGVAGFKRYREV